MQPGLAATSITAILIALAFLTLLLGIRLKAGGASASLVRKVVAELWAAIALWALLFMTIARLLGQADADTLGEEARGLWRRILLASGPVKAWSCLLAALALTVFVLLFRHLSLALGEASPNKEKTDE